MMDKEKIIESITQLMDSRQLPNYVLAIQLIQSQGLQDTFWVSYEGVVNQAKKLELLRKLTALYPREKLGKTLFARMFSLGDELMEFIRKESPHFGSFLVKPDLIESDPVLRYDIKALVPSENIERLEKKFEHLNWLDKDGLYKIHRQQLRYKHGYIRAYGEYTFDLWITVARKSTLDILCTSKDYNVVFSEISITTFLPFRDFLH